jgi:hemoglobin
MARHAPFAVDARHFDRWQALFEKTARELCPPRAATIS